MNLRFSAVLVAVVFSCAAGMYAQAPAAGPGQPGARQGDGNQAGGQRGGRQGGGAARQAPQPIPVFFRESWKAGATAVPTTQAVVANPDLIVAVYGKAAGQPEVNEEGGVPHIWTGLCAPACAVTLKHKASFADLTGKARMKWYAKTSGFHEIRPVVKLADGTWLVGSYADSSLTDYHEVDFFLADVRWIRLDIDTLTTKGGLLDKVDLSKVDEIGFVDLTPGSGHGLGGYSDMGWIEVHGKPVAR